MYDKQEVLKYLYEVGICVFEDYYSPEECDKCVSDIDRCMVEFEDRVQKQAEVKEEDYGDERLFKMENQSELAYKFATDEFILEIATSFYGTLSKSKVAHILAGRLFYDSVNVRSSGGGWHVDSKGLRQIKAMVYLTDVDEDNGPYMFLPGSKAYALPGQEGMKNQLAIRVDYRGRKTRFTDEGIEKTGLEPFVVTGKKGTVIVSDTSYVHRGSVINKGKRYSLTSYLQKETEIYRMEKKYNEWYVPKRVK